MVVASPEPARKALSQSQARTTGYSPRTQSSTPSTRARTTGGSPRTPSSTPVWGAHDRRLSVHAVPDSKRAQPAARRRRTRRPRFQACARLLRPVHDLASQLQPALEDLADWCHGAARLSSRSTSRRHALAVWEYKVRIVVAYLRGHAGVRGGGR